MILKSWIFLLMPPFPQPFFPSTGISGNKSAVMAPQGEAIVGLSDQRNRQVESQSSQTMFIFLCRFHRAGIRFIFHLGERNRRGMLRASRYQERLLLFSVVTSASHGALPM